MQFQASRSSNRTLRSTTYFVVLISLAVLTEGCQKPDPQRPSELVGEWVHDTLIPWAISAEDTVVSPEDTPNEAWNKQFLQNIYRDDPLRGGDTSYITYKLALRRNGAATRRITVEVMNNGKQRKGQDSTIAYSAWHLHVDSTSNAAILCLDEAGYGERTCSSLRIRDGKLAIRGEWESTDGRMERLYRRTD
jgi:hypothetical protein